MTRLYLITPAKLDLPVFAEQFKAALDAGDVASVQLRLKEATDKEWQKAIEKLMPIAWERDIPFIINDRVDLVKKFSADGVHLGEHDTSYDEARKTLGGEAIIGISCYDSKDRAMEHAEKGADYVAFGAAYPTTTKKVKAYVPVETYRDWVAMTTIPVVAIGGINAFNCAPVVQAGVDFIAVVSAVWKHPESPAQGVKDLLKAMARS